MIDYTCPARDFGLVQYVDYDVYKNYQNFYPMTETSDIAKVSG